MAFTIVRPLRGPVELVHVQGDSNTYLVEAKNHHPLLPIPPSPRRPKRDRGTFLKAAQIYPNGGGRSVHSTETPKALASRSTHCFASSRDAQLQLAGARCAAVSSDTNFPENSPERRGSIQATSLLVVMASPRFMPRSNLPNACYSPVIYPSYRDATTEFAPARTTATPCGEMPLLPPPRRPEPRPAAPRPPRVVGCRQLIDAPGEQSGSARTLFSARGQSAWLGRPQVLERSRSASARTRSASLPASARSARPTTASACFSARTTSADSASTCSFSRSTRCRSSANARSASARTTINSAFSSSSCARSAFVLARSSARSARVAFKGRAARMVVVARSVPAGAAAEAAVGGIFGGGMVRKAEAGAGRVLDDWDSAEGRRLLLRQALLKGDEVDAGQWRCSSNWWLSRP